MQYITRLADKPGEAHVNYQCPCGCTAGLMYDRESGSMHLGECCCGRLLWLGSDAEAFIGGKLREDTEYELDIASVTLPWGDITTAALAVPVRSRQVISLDLDEPHDHHDHEHEHHHDHESHHHHDHDGHDHHHAAVAERVKDVVCGMIIDPATAAATSSHRGKTYYFCALGCKRKFDAEPRRYAPGGGILGWLRR